MPLLFVLISNNLCLIMSINAGSVSEDLIISLPDFEPGVYTLRLSATDVFEQSGIVEIPFSLTGESHYLPLRLK